MKGTYLGASKTTTLAFRAIAAYYTENVTAEERRLLQTTIEDYVHLHEDQVDVIVQPSITITPSEVVGVHAARAMVIAHNLDLHNDVIGSGYHFHLTADGRLAIASHRQRPLRVVHGGSFHCYTPEGTAIPPITFAPSNRRAEELRRASQ